jgi:hypothetical protein
VIDLTTVEGCAVCRVPKRDHAQRWTEGVGWHTHVMPDPELIKARMRARFNAKETT